MLFETAESAAAGESAASGDQSKDIQINFTDFLANLFHFKPGAKGYSIDPANFDKVPLFIQDKEGTTVLNEFFFYVFSRALSWQSLTRYHPRKSEEGETVPLRYDAIDASASGPSLPEIRGLSKNFVAYFASFLGAAPYFKSTDVRSKLDKRFSKALKFLNRLDDEQFDQYVRRKLRTWYTKFPPSRPTADDGEDKNNGADDEPGAGSSAGEEMDCPDMSGDEE